MHKLNINADDNSIDFDFFETEGNRVKPFENEKKYSSKIVTKAVIEAKPKEILNSSTQKTLKLNASIGKENSVKPKIDDSISSPTSSEEKRLLGTAEDITLFNCLAYNDNFSDGQMFNMDDKYLSDNSLSDSTITTVTSDFTSVSRLSSMSDSSCGSDFSNDLSTPQNLELITNDNEGNFIDNTKDLDSELSGKISMKVDESDGSENHIHKANNCREFITADYEYDRDDHDSQSQGTNSSAADLRENKSSNTSSEKINTNIQSDNLYEEETIKENLEHSQRYNRLSRKESISTISLEERLNDISLASQSSSNSSMAKGHNYCRGQNRFRSKRKDLNLTFSREELIKIERDNTILLKKIMSYSKPRSVLLNHTFSHKKTSAAINRARQQKKIEQDNYILYSKINAMNRMKKVF